METIPNSSKKQKPIGFSPSEISALINREVMEQHAEEAAFLWSQRDAATLAPNFSLKDLAALDERVEAHLDGLRTAGRIGWKICEDGLDSQEPGEVFTAAELAFESMDSERIAKVLEVGSLAPALERSLISALGWLPLEGANDHMENLTLSSHPEICCVGIGAFAVHRKDPGPALSKALRQSHPRLRSRALKAAGELGRTDLLPLVLRLTSDTDDECQFFAAWAAARLGDRSQQTFMVLREMVERHGRHAENALGIMLRCMDLEEARACYQYLLDNPQHLRLAAIGAGVIGLPDLVPDLVALMEIKEVARVAGEAFSFISGVDLAFEDLDDEVPEFFEVGPIEEPEDEDVGMDPDENLSWPSVELVSRWWRKHDGNFHFGVRYLVGHEITAKSLKDTLVRGKQHQRAAAALELALRNPRAPLFEVRAPGKRQIKELGL